MREVMENMPQSAASDTIVVEESESYMKVLTGEQNLSQLSFLREGEESKSASRLTK